MDPHSTFLAICLAVGFLGGTFLSRLVGRRRADREREARRPRKARDAAREEALRAAWAELDAIDRAHGVHPEQIGDIEEPRPASNSGPDNFPFDVTLPQLQVRLDMENEAIRFMQDRMKNPDTADPRDFAKLRAALKRRHTLVVKMDRIRTRGGEVAGLPPCKCCLRTRDFRDSRPSVLDFSRSGELELTCPDCVSRARAPMIVSDRAPGHGLHVPATLNEGGIVRGPVPVVADPELIASQWGRGSRKPPPDPKFPGTR